MPLSAAQIDCQGECSWGWVLNDSVEHWNFLDENTTCSLYCSCSPPEVAGEFNGQVVFTPCQPPTEQSMRQGESMTDYIARVSGNS